MLRSSSVANLQIKDLPRDLHEELRRRARLEGVTVRAYVLGLIEADQSLPLPSEWLARVRARRAIDPGRPVAELLAEDRDRSRATVPGPTSPG